MHDACQSLSIRYCPTFSLRDHFARIRSENPQIRACYGASCAPRARTRIRSAPGRDRGHSWRARHGSLAATLARDATRCRPDVQISHDIARPAARRPVRSAVARDASRQRPACRAARGVARARRAAERNARRTPSVLAAVFHVDAQTTALVRTLMTQYTEIANRSSKLENQLWRALFDLTQGFLACYAAFAREIVDHGHHSRWQALLPELIARADRPPRHVTRRSGSTAASRGSPRNGPSSTRCSPARARCSSSASRCCSRPAPGPTTIEREYLVALFLQQADPGNLTPRQIEWVATSSRNGAGRCGSRWSPSPPRRSMSTSRAAPA